MLNAAQSTWLKKTVCNVGAHAHKMYRFVFSGKSRIAWVGVRAKA